MNRSEVPGCVTSAAAYVNWTLYTREMT